MRRTVFVDGRGRQRTWHARFGPHLRHLDGLTRRFRPSNFPPEKGEDAYEIEVDGCRRCGCSGFVCARRKRPIIHQRADRRHIRRLLPARRRDRKDLRRQDSEREDPGAGHQGLGREPDPAAAGPRRDRVHARRFPESGLGGRRGGRLQVQAGQAAHHRRDLSELHPDRRDRRQRHQDAGRSEGQEPLGRRAEIRNRTQFARDPRRRRHDLQGSGQGRVSAVRRIRRPDEKPPARRDAAIGRPRRRLAEGPLDLDRASTWCRCRRRSSTRSARPSCR